MVVLNLLMARKDMAADPTTRSGVEEPNGSDDWTLDRLRETGVKHRFVNVLGHGRLYSGIDVKQLALLVRNADYRPRGFGALVLRFQEPRASMLIYKSGKFIVVGAKTPTDAHTTVDKFISVLQLLAFTIANVICSIDLKFRVRLEGLAHEHRRFCTYEPELFPGLIYRYLRSNVTLLVFVSGKVVITGSKTTEQAEDVLVQMYPVLLQYRWREELSSSDSESDADADVELGESDDSDVGTLL
ncbi:hypothetical protein ATCC90586_000654 [Pythium insidiosum]|nr:hypothetical protein ATCC90586_000654 [Pythium insidiosum]